MIAPLPLPTLFPLSDDRSALLHRLTDGLDSAALQWLSGYAAGLAVQGARPTRALQAVPDSLLAGESDVEARVSVVYGSQTGNARRVAEQLARDLEDAGLSVRLWRADTYPLRELSNERLLYLVISTQGDGDPPDDAYSLVEFLNGRKAPALKALRYAVLGLGDSSYPKFNAVAQQLDLRLEVLGGQRLFELGQADVDIETVAQPWRKQAIELARDVQPSSTITATVTPLRPAQTLAEFNRDRPFLAEVLTSQQITGRDSQQAVRHLELSLSGSGFDYEPGDAIGVWPQQASSLVDEVLDTLGLDGGQVITHGEHSLPLHEWLRDRRELTRLSRPFLLRHAEQSADAKFTRLLQPDQRDALAAQLVEWQLPDLLKAYPVDWSGEAIVAALQPLVPRLYSISSSRKAVGDEVHLTVSLLEGRAGVASGYLATKAEGEPVSIYLERNDRFRLPNDGDRNILMIGPGTGVAPFRGFLQERIATNARGKNWLLFGARHAQSQFLYQIEWQDALRQGHLHALDLAFSRDQPERIYVQQRLREQSKHVFDWIEGGAHLYVCGAVAMGKDVHATLLKIISEHGNRSADDAIDYLNQLQSEGRYARDVY